MLRAARPRPGVALALVSAVLFGATTPLAKLLLSGGLPAQLLAGLFYLGSGVGLGLFLVLRRLSGRVPKEAQLRRADLAPLAIAVVVGGAVAPVLLMLGLTRTSATSAALLLNLEGLATMAIAWIVFRENVDRRILTGAMAILAGAVVLAWNGGPAHFGSGALLIAGACIAWGTDNNVTRKLAGADPVQIAAIKGLVAGSANFALALAIQPRLPSATTALIAGSVGFFGYGVSLVLFVLGLRDLGVARTSAYFSTAPFIGALLAVALLSEPFTLRLVVAGLLMAAGVYLHVHERHEHSHHHEALEHEHRHVHDEHHQHAHAADDPAGEPHSHPHRHEPLTHEHPHYPDLHHRHDHS